MKKKQLLRIAFVLVGVAAVGALGYWGYYEAMKRAWIRYNEYDIRSEGLLSVGDLAPDLELQRVDGSGPVRLSELYADKPVVLVFGSYT